MAKPSVLLYPGAGSGREHSSLVTIERSLGAGALVERLDFPYRKQGRRAPDRAPKLMAAIRDDLAIVRRRRGPVVLGGRSMGGRMTSMVAADVDGVGPVSRLAGLVLFCYPLHPPGKPDRLRVEHLHDLLQLDGYMAGKARWITVLSGAAAHQKAFSIAMLIRD